jgi:hypothetical protein
MLRSAARPPIRALAFVLVGALIVLSVFPVFAQDQPPMPVESLEARRALAESGARFVPPLAPANAGELATALDVGAPLLTSAVRTGANQAAGVFSNLGTITPRSGNSLIVLSSGVAGTSSPEIGTDFGIEGAFNFDEATLTLTFNLPPGVSRITFDYMFFSAEFPEFVGSIFNDTSDVK